MIWLRRLAVANLGVVLLLGLGNVVLAVMAIARGHSDSIYWAAFPALPLGMLLASVGALVVSRHPTHRIGLGICLVTTLAMASTLFDTYAFYGLRSDPGSLPGAAGAAWLYEWMWIPAEMPLLTFFFLLCPDGHLLSPRWRLVAQLVGLNLVLLTLAFALHAGPLPTYPEVDNPFGLNSLQRVTELAQGIGILLLIPSVLLSCASMVLRFHRSRGVERLQLKWFAAAAAGAGLLSLVAYVVGEAFDLGDEVWTYALPPIIALVIVAAGIAILRYRLYDIDRIINRTLVYGLLTAGLGLTYFGLVVGLQALLRPISGGSDLAIVLTTLVVAALFLPARRRVQHAVDRRFNRRAYDAARTIDAFSARLREQIDLDTLRYELLSVVDETMQPAKASLWLRAVELRQ
jgi:hypothetical protein